jgi:hypothetical protein
VVPFPLSSVTDWVGGDSHDDRDGRRLPHSHRCGSSRRPAIFWQSGFAEAGASRNSTRPDSAPVFFQACGTPRGMNAQVPGPPTVISSPILRLRERLPT